MKASDRAILIGVLVVAVFGAFYLMILSPKREEAAQLGKDIETLEEQIAEQEQVAAFAEQARDQFPTYYGRMVVLGKAVPDQGDQASLLVQLNSIAGGNKLAFEQLDVVQGGGEAEAAAVPAPAAAPTEGTAPAEGTESAATPAATGAPAGAVTPATEASAASLPIGATVGAAGLPTLPYDLAFRGDFFDVVDFIGGVDGLVHPPQGADGQVKVDGRLLTIDGFSLIGGEPGDSPTLDARFLMTSYVTPSTEGLTLGASPSGPVSPVPTTPAAAPAAAEVVP
jgi:hypothetical protein